MFQIIILYLQDKFNFFLYKCYRINNCKCYRISNEYDSNYLCITSYKY